MQKEARRRTNGGGKPAPRKLEREENPVFAAIIGQPIPSQARVLLVGLAVSAFESALAEDGEAVLVGFALLRKIVRELEALFEQMSRGSGVNNRSLRKGPGKSIEVSEPLRRGQGNGTMGR